VKCDVFILQQLQDLLDQKMERFPLLKTIAIGLPKAASGDGEETNVWQALEEKLNAEYGEAGVGLHIIRPGDPTEHVFASMA